MEHILNIGVVIDDDAVQRSVVKDLVNLFESRTYEAIRSKRGYYCPSSRDETLRSFAEDAIMKFFDEHKAELIEAAASIVAQRLSRTKAIKECREGERETINQSR